MKPDLHSCMRVGIVHGMAYPGAAQDTGILLESVRSVCCDPFFESIEVTHIEDPEARTEVAKLLQGSHMEVGFACQPVQLGRKLDLNAFDEAARAAAVRAVKELLAEAVELGATKLAVVSGPDPGPARREEAIELLVDSLGEVCAAAEALGISVVLEVFDRGIDKKALIGSTRDAVRVAARLRPRFPDFGLMLDLSHLPLQGERPRAAVELARDYITHIHVGNCVLEPGHPLYGDLHPPFGIPGGVNDVDELAEFLRALWRIGYLQDGGERTVAFEVRPREGEASEIVIANAKRTLLAAWRRV
mgnify:CR=1 FL=1